MSKIKEKVDEYLGFGSELLFNSDYQIRLFGGAIRDIISDSPINDLDILVQSRDLEGVISILQSFGYQKMEDFYSTEMTELYDSSIIYEPKTFLKSVGNGISKVQLIRPSSYKFHDVIWNIDLTCCCVSWDGHNLYENYPDAILDCRLKMFNEIEGSVMDKKIAIRINKLLKRGWTSKRNLSKADKRNIELEKLVPDENISFIKEYQSIVRSTKPRTWLDSLDIWN